MHVLLKYNFFKQTIFLCLLLIVHFIKTNTCLNDQPSKYVKNVKSTYFLRI